MRAVFPAVAVAAIASGLVSPTAVRAQSIPSAYSFVDASQEVGLFIGYMGTATGRFGYGPSGGTMLGGRYGLELTGPLSIEAVGALVRGTRDIINPARAEGNRVVGQGDVRLWVLDGRLKFSATGTRAWHRLSPFLVVGGGVAFDVAGTQVAEADLQPADVFSVRPSFVGTVGVGTRWYVTQNFALRTDGTFSLFKIKTPVGFSTRFEGVEAGEWVRSLAITVSLLFRW